jgi:hypothetical protein
MQHGGADFMRLWEVKNIYTLYEIVLTSVALKESVHWKLIYDFDNSSPYFSNLCVAVLIIHNALKYGFVEEKLENSILQHKEFSIVKSYYGI